MIASLSWDTNRTSGCTMSPLSTSRITSSGAIAICPRRRGSTWSPRIFAMRSTIAWWEKNGAGGSRSTPYASSRGRFVSSVSRYSKVVMTTTMPSSRAQVKWLMSGGLGDWWSRRPSAKSGNEAQRLRGHRFHDRGARAGAAEDRSDDHAARVVRQAADVLDEPGELAIPVQVALDIRHVERRHAAAAGSDRLGNGLHRVGARHVADDR